MSTTKTRRKSKAAAADDTQITLTVPEDIDLDVLSSLLPDMSLETPSVDTILALYRLVLDQVADIDTKQQDLDEARAEGEKKDVELDQALQDRETLTSDLDTQIHSLQDELKQVKQERDALCMWRSAFQAALLTYFLVSSQSDLQTQISRLSSTSSASSTELDDLKHRLQDSEREKRDLMGVVSRLKQDEAQRDGASPLVCISICSCCVFRGNPKFAQELERGTPRTSGAGESATGTTVNGHVKQSMNLRFSGTIRV